MIGTTSWEPAPFIPPATGWRSHDFIPVQEWGAAVGVLPLPSPKAPLAWPLWPWWSYYAGLWGFVAENMRGRRFGVTSSPQLYKRLLVPMPACTWTRMLIPRQHAAHAHRHTTFKKKKCFCLRWMAGGTLVPRPSIEPTLSAVEARSLNQWTTRGVPGTNY